MFWKKIIFIGSVFLTLTAFPAEAGVISARTEKENFGLGERLVVDFLLDTKNQKINAVEGKIIYSSKHFELVQISQKDSIVSNWLKSPARFSEKEDESAVIFSGLIPGGYRGSEAPLLSLVLETINPGKTEITMKGVRTLLDDSKGTQVSSVFIDRIFMISPVPFKEENDPRLEKILEDKNSPFSFEIGFSKSENVFSGQWFLAFDAKDDKSGVSHYLVQENEFSVPEEGKWEKVEKGPYLLKDQKLKSFVFVKAVDYAGNEKLEFLGPQKYTKKFDKIKYSVIIKIVFALAVTALVLPILVSFFRRKNNG